MPDGPADPKEMADMLEAIARRLRRTAADEPRVPAPSPGGLYVGAPPVEVEDRVPALGEVDVFSDATHVTVTAQTRNADAQHVHVSVADGNLHIGLGNGATVVRRELPLPGPVDEEHAYATFRNGVLDVVLPRKGLARRDFP